MSQTGVYTCLKHIRAKTVKYEAVNSKGMFAKNRATKNKDSPITLSSVKANEWLNPIYQVVTSKDLGVAELVLFS